ncbi:MAG: histidinol dehydrogenase [Desulfosalsimonadaceae bacterium]
MEILNYPSDEAERRVEAVAGRGLFFDPDKTRAVEEILEAVRTRGDEALLEYSRRFDAPQMQQGDLAVEEQAFDAAEVSVDEAFLKALDRAAGQIEAFHRRQLRNSWFQTSRSGVFLGQMVKPVQAAGVYVPGAKGGMTPLVSSVLMGAIPARIAGVERIVMTTPPREDGSVDPHLLAAARRVGVDAVYRAGSAWAIAGLAFGTRSLPRVDVIAGPGNIYVTIAKKLVSGSVGIDMTAGPSEILVVADRSADPEFIAADLLSQAEHDTLASAILLTDSAAVAETAAGATERRLADLPRKEVAEQSLAAYGGIIVVPEMEVAVSLANRIAPEHLELLVAEPFAWLGAIRNAGAVFMGHFTPEPMGDYVAGPNHVLPTGGTARFSSALSVDTFMKQTSLICYSQQAMDREAEDVIRLAEIEGLGAHAESVRVRRSKR